MSRSTPRILALAIGISVLAGCSSPAAPLGPVTVKATLAAGPGSGTAVAAFYVMQDGSFMVILDASGVVSPSPGIYVGPASPVDADATAHLVLPDPHDLPEEVLGTATSFVQVISSGPVVCPTTASVPSATVSKVLFSNGMSSPMVFILTGDGLTTSYTGDKKVDFTASEEQLFHMRFVTWLYADNDVDVKTAPGGCVNGTDPTVVVDLNLRKGWNQVAWTMQEGGPSDPVTITLGNGADIDPIYMSYTAGG